MRPLRTILLLLADLGRTLVSAWREGRRKV
jgi:hypothetical protein